MSGMAKTSAQLDAEIAAALGRPRRHHATARARSFSQYPGAEDWDVAMDALLGPRRHHATARARSFSQYPGAEDWDVAMDALLGPRRHHATARARSFSQYPGAEDWDVAMDALLADDPKRAAEVVRAIRKEPGRAQESGSPAFEETLREVPSDVREKFFAHLDVRTAHRHVDAIKGAIYRTKDPDALVAAVREATKHVNAMQRLGRRSASGPGYSYEIDSSGAYDPAMSELGNLLVDAKQYVANIKKQGKATTRARPSCSRTPRRVTSESAENE